MTPQSSIDPRAVAGKAREVIARVRPGERTARRSLPIRRPAEEIRRTWDDPEARAAVLDGLPEAEATLAVGAPAGEWGTTVTLTLELRRALPGTATHVLAGKAVRRLKAVVETGEAPTTERNPSARADAGETAA